MYKYGKTAQNAVSAISLLAEVYDRGETRLSARDIAQRRALPRPIVAKLLVVLSQAGFVSGAPGPNGGYWLGKAPEEITLCEIAELFEKAGGRMMCPFGPNYCGHGDQCPLHDTLLRMDDELTSFLEQTTFAVFNQTTDKAK
jgi:Rrf2 family protein